MPSTVIAVLRAAAASAAATPAAAGSHGCIGFSAQVNVDGGRAAAA